MKTPKKRKIISKTRKNRSLKKENIKEDEQKKSKKRRKIV